MATATRVNPGVKARPRARVARLVMGRVVVGVVMIGLVETVRVGVVMIGRVVMVRVVVVGVVMIGLVVMVRVAVVGVVMIGLVVMVRVAVVVMIGLVETETMVSVEVELEDCEATVAHRLPKPARKAGEVWLVAAQLASMKTKANMNLN